MNTSPSYRHKALSCSFCRREAQDVSVLINGESTAICNFCIVEFLEILGTAARAVPVGTDVHRDTESWCGFCGTRVKAVDGVVVRNGVAVCRNCLHCSADILASHP